MLDAKQGPVVGVETIERLREALGPCVRRAQETGRPVLLRVHACWGGAAPWDVLCGCADMSGAVPYVAWNDASRGLVCAGWGVVGAGVVGVDSYAQAGVEQQRLLDAVVDVHLSGVKPVVDVPLVWMGFSFGASGQGVWSDAPFGYVYVPQWQVYGSGGYAGSVWSCSVLPGEPLEVVLDAYLAAWKHVSGAVCSPVLGAPVVCAEEALEGEEAWCARVGHAKAAIAAGVFEKVVLSRAVRWCAPEGCVFDVPGVLGHLRATHPRSVTFAVCIGRGYTFLGSTPEVLLDVSGRKVCTQALAGTAARGATPAEDAGLEQDLLASVKNRQEHAFVADVLKTWLEQACVEVVSSAAPRVVKLPHVQHLETLYEGRLRQAGGMLEHLEQLHPTPAVSGWPRGSASAWIAEHEPVGRGWYAGPVGWMTAAGDGVAAVAIRSVKMGAQDAWGFAGAGVVALSEPEAEWHETAMKLNTVRAALCVVPKEPLV